MKPHSERRFLTLVLRLPDLLEYLRAQGRIDAVSFPADLRIASVTVPDGAPPESLLITLESDSLPEDCRYAGYLRAIQVDLRNPPTKG